MPIVETPQAVVDIQSDLRAPRFIRPGETIEYYSAAFKGRKCGCIKVVTKTAYEREPGLLVTSFRCLMDDGEDLSPENIVIDGKTIREWWESQFLD